MDQHIEKMKQGFKETPIFPICENCKHYAIVQSNPDVFINPGICSIGNFDTPEDASCKKHEYLEKDMSTNLVFECHLFFLLNFYFISTNNSSWLGYNLSQCPTLTDFQTTLNSHDKNLSEEQKSDYIEVMTAFGFPEKAK